MIFNVQRINDHEACADLGFRFVTFKDEKSMRDTIEIMNCQDLAGGNITVNEAQAHPLPFFSLIFHRSSRSF